MKDKKIANTRMQLPLFFMEKLAEFNIVYTALT